MNKKELIKTIKEDSHCLWEALARFIMEDTRPDDCQVARECSVRLTEALDWYQSHDLTLMDEVDLWFAYTVLDSYYDLSARNIVKSN